MKKFLLVFALCLLLASPAAALTLAWDSYQDPIATGIRIYSSTDNVNFTLLVDNIPTTATSVDIPDGPDYTRVYYHAKGYDADGESEPSNVVSFMWSTGGGGYEGLSPVDGVHLLDCDAILLDPNHPDYGVCLGRHQP